MGHYFKTSIQDSLHWDIILRCLYRIPYIGILFQDVYTGFPTLGPSIQDSLGTLF